MRLNRQGHSPSYPIAHKMHVIGSRAIDSLIAHFGAVMATKTIYSTAYRRPVTQLRETREAAGLSQSALAATLGWPQQRLSAVEAGARRLDVMEFLHLTGALGLSPEAAIQLADPKAGPSTRSRQVRKRG